MLNFGLCISFFPIFVVLIKQMSLLASYTNYSAMKKQTLQFLSLSELTLFSKTLPGGYLINTNNFTVTGKFHELQVNMAIELYHAMLIETTDKVFSYDF